MQSWNGRIVIVADIFAVTVAAAVNLVAVVAIVVAAAVIAVALIVVVGCDNFHFLAPL